MDEPVEEGDTFNFGEGFIGAEAFGLSAGENVYDWFHVISLLKHRRIVVCGQAGN